jgi:hypothetical protein
MPATVQSFEPFRGRDKQKSPLRGAYPNVTSFATGERAARAASSGCYAPYRLKTASTVTKLLVRAVAIGQE